MIESRYKIEYELPEDEVKTTSPLKVIWYLTLIPLIVLAVTAITYDFSIKDIKQDSLVLWEKTKVHVFNLGERHQFQRPLNSITNQSILSKPSTEVSSSQTINSNNSKDTGIDKTTSENIKAKVEIQSAKPQETKTALTNAASNTNEDQGNNQEKITENKQLTKNLKAITDQLALEKLKNANLNTKLSYQEQDRLELEEQLNEILSDPTPENVNSTIEESQKIVLEKAIPESSVKTAVIQSAEIIEVETKEVQQKPEPTQPSTDISNDTENQDTNDTQVVTEQSETDKIIAAMSSVTPTPETTPSKPEVEIETAPLLDTSSQPDQEITNSAIQTKALIPSDSVAEVMTPTQDPKTEEVTLRNPETPLSDIGNNTSNNTSKDIQTSDAKPKEEANIETVKISAEPQPVIVEVNESPEVATSNDSTLAPLQAEESTRPVVNSSVDDIIAAMEASQASNADTNQNVDPKLEQQIKRQLVEQGDISIDSE